MILFILKIFIPQNDEKNYVKFVLYHKQRYFDRKVSNKSCKYFFVDRYSDIGCTTQGRNILGSRELELRYRLNERKVANWYVIYVFVFSKKFHRYIEKYGTVKSCDNHSFCSKL